MPLEEGDAKFLFQGFHVLRHGVLRQVKLFGGFGKTLMMGHFAKADQLGDIHLISPRFFLGSPLAQLR